MSNDEMAFKEAFDKHELPEKVRNAKVTAVVAAVLILAGFILDYFSYPESFGKFFVIRCIASVATLMVYFLLKVDHFSNEVKIKYAQVLTFPVLFMISFMIYDTEGASSPYYAGLNLILVGLVVVLKWSPKFSILMALCVIGVYTLSIVLSDGTITTAVIVNNYFFLATNACLVAFGAHFYEITRKNEYRFKLQTTIQSKALEEKNEELTELDRMKTDFFANISHELRTPLTIILGNTDRLNESLKGSKHDSLLTPLRENGLRLLKLIDNLLELVKFDLNEAQVQYSSVHIDDFFNFFSLRIAPLLERKGLRYEKDWVNSGQILELDENKLDQILNNLVINAIKFTPSGGKIRVFYHYDHGEFVFGVQDNGVGMSQEAQKKIFTRFWQESSSANRRFRGTGIGLNLVKNMVAAMEGTIAIDSTLGEGTCFTVKLPAKVGQAGNEGDQEAPSSMGVIEAYHKEASFSGAELESYRDSEAVEIVYNGSDEKEAKLVLVADDEPELRVFITECLQEHHRVLACQDGGMAIRLAKEYQPDLIVLDYMMPSMDGIDVVKVLKQDPDLIETPVVMLTARADNELKLRALGQGVLDFLPKPFSPVELQLRISNLLTQDGYKREVQKKSQELEATMEKLVESETKLIQNEQLAALGRMSAGLIHEINNPLNYSKTASTLLKRDIDAGKELDPEDVSDYLEDITEGVERVSEIVADLRGFATNSNMELKVVELQPVLAKSKKLLADQLSQHNIKLTLDMPTSIGVVANELKLSQIFVNMLQNSIYALADVQRDKQIRLTAYEEGERVIVKIWDNGCGIEKDKVQRIFEPFYTTRDVGQGMGLGLSIVSKTLTDFGAELTLHSELQKFTEFILSFEAKER